MARFKLHVTPGAREERIVGWHGDSLRIKVRARPEKGRANDSVLRLLAGSLGLSRANVAIVRGFTSRDKLIDVHGLSAEELRAKLDDSRR